MIKLIAGLLMLVMLSGCGCPTRATAKSCASEESRIKKCDKFSKNLRESGVAHYGEENADKSVKYWDREEAMAFKECIYDTATPKRQAKSYEDMLEIIKSEEGKYWLCKEGLGCARTSISMVQTYLDGGYYFNSVDLEEKQ